MLQISDGNSSLTSEYISMTPNFNIQFEDLQVKAICCKNWDTNNDGELSYAEAAAVTDIGTAFSGNENIISFTELQYFTGLTIIPKRAFHSCTYLWKITIPKNVKKIDSLEYNDCSTFKNCTNLTSVILPEGLISIEAGAFFGCEGLVNLTIPNSVTTIGPSAFSGCLSLKEMVIPTSFTTLGNVLFLWMSIIIIIEYSNICIKTNFDLTFVRNV